MMGVSQVGSCPRIGHQDLTSKAEAGNGRQQSPGLALVAARIQAMAFRPSQRRWESQARLRMGT
jgi:hypothetical protein